MRRLRCWAGSLRLQWTQRRRRRRTLLQPGRPPAPAPPPPGRYPCMSACNILGKPAPRGVAPKGLCAKGFAVVRWYAAAADTGAAGPGAAANVTACPPSSPPAGAALPPPPLPPLPPLSCGLSAPDAPADLPLPFFGAATGAATPTGVDSPLAFAAAWSAMIFSMPIVFLCLPKNPFTAAWDLEGTAAAIALKSFPCSVSAARNCERSL